MRQGYSYTDAEVLALIARLGAAAPNHLIDERALVRDLVSIMTALGLTALTDEDVVFADQVKRRAFRARTGRTPANDDELAAAVARIVPTQIAKTRATLYEAIAAANAVALPAAVAAAIAHDNVLVTELRAGLHFKTPLPHQATRPPIVTLSDLLPYGLPSEPDLLRAAAGRLARLYGSWVRAGQRVKVAQWTALSLLADVFLRFTGSRAGPMELSHAERSHFISFAHLVLQPFVPTTEASVGALSKAWKRIKDGETADGF